MISSIERASLVDHLVESINGEHYPLSKDSVTYRMIDHYVNQSVLFALCSHKDALSRKVEQNRILTLLGIPYLKLCDINENDPLVALYGSLLDYLLFSFSEKTVLSDIISLIIIKIDGPYLRYSYCKNFVERAITLVNSVFNVFDSIKLNEELSK